MAQFWLMPEKQIDMKSIILALTLVVSCYSLAQDTKSQGILDKVSTKLKANKTFYVEFSSEVKKGSSSTTTSGKGWVKGEKFSTTYGENMIISNGKKNWTILKKDKTVNESVVEDDEESLNPKKLMTMWESGFKNKYEKEETLNGVKVHVITLTPTNTRSSNYTSITVYISKDSNELKKAVMKAKDNSVTTYSITKFTSNPTVEDSKFVYDSSKYPGYKLVKS